MAIQYFQMIIFLLITLINLSICKDCDRISEINYKIWTKNHLTWSFVNHPTNLINEHKNLIYYEFVEAFNSWELISHFRFELIMNSTDADIVITFAPPNHRLFEGNHHFTSDSLAHAYFPENGDIHLNDNVNCTLFVLSTEYYKHVLCNCSLDRSFIRFESCK